MKKNITGPVYDLTPAQDMIQFMLKYSFFHKQVTQIPESILTTKEIDFDVMKQALNIEIGAVQVLNPGSAGKGRPPSCGLVTVFDNGGVACEVKEI